MVNVEKVLLVICCVACLCNAISSFAICMQLWSDNRYQNSSDSSGGND